MDRCRKSGSTTCRNGCSRSHLWRQFIVPPHVPVYIYAQLDVILGLYVDILNVVSRVGSFSATHLWSHTISIGEGKKGGRGCATCIQNASF